MGYRKINIEGKQYEYVVGRSNVHIKFPDGDAVNVARDVIGVEVGARDCGCGCGGDCPDIQYDVMVGPAQIKAFILKGLAE